MQQNLHTHQPMKTIADKLDRIAEVSRSILDEVQKEKPSVNSLEQHMEKRRKLIGELDQLTENIDASFFSAEEQQKLARGFRTFRKLHQSIQPALTRLKDEKEQVLGVASQKRKAEQSYQLLETPDISYF